MCHYILLQNSWGFKILLYLRRVQFIVIFSIAEDQDIGHYSCTFKYMGFSKVYQTHRVCVSRQIDSQFLAIFSPHPFVWCDIVEWTALFQQLMSSLIKQAINVTATIECFISTRGIQISQFSFICLQLNIWWITYDNIKTIRYAKHPLNIEKWRNWVLVIWVPFGYLQHGGLEALRGAFVLFALNIPFAGSDDTVDSVSFSLVTVVTNQLRLSKQLRLYRLFSPILTLIPLQQFLIICYLLLQRAYFLLVGFSHQPADVLVYLLALGFILFQ